MKRKLLFTIVCAFFCISINAQSETSQATRNGCLDGGRSAESANIALQSILNNNSISAEYKDAYRQSWAICREKARNGTYIGCIKIINGKKTKCPSPNPKGGHQ